MATRHAIGHTTPVMFRPAYRRATCGLLLLALAYSLGAAPCGCWEHSGWRAAIAFAWGKDQLPPPDVERFDGHECDDPPKAAAVVTPRPTVEDSLLAAAAVPLDDTTQAASGSLARSAVSERLSRVAAPPVRALTQVFRI